MLSISDFRKQVLAEIAAHAPKEGRLHIFYDPMLADRLGLWIDPNDDAASATSFGEDAVPLPSARISANALKMHRVLPPKRIGLVSKNSAPLVIELGEVTTWSDHRLLESSITVAHHELAQGSASVKLGRSICGWLWSTATVGSIAAHLTDVCVLPRPTVSARWVRWHDPRVRSQMWPYLNAAQRRQVLGPIAAWVGVNALGSIYTIVNTSDRSRSSIEPTLALKPEQWRRLDHCFLVHQLLEAWQQFRDPLPTSAVDTLHSHLLRARDLGLHDDSDLSAYALFAIQCRSDFERHEAVANAITETCANPGSLMLRFKAVGDDCWQRLAA